MKGNEGFKQDNQTEDNQTEDNQTEDNQTEDNQTEDNQTGQWRLSGNTATNEQYASSNNKGYEYTVRTSPISKKEEER